MKMRVFALLLLVFGFTFQSCRKQKLLEVPTLIRVVLSYDNFTQEELDAIVESDEFKWLFLMSSKDFDGSDIEVEGALTTFPGEIFYEVNRASTNLEILIDWNEFDIEGGTNVGRFKHFKAITKTYNFSDLEPSYTIKESHKVKIKPGYIYDWDMEAGTFEQSDEEYEGSSSTGASNELVGKWSQVNSCENASGERNSFTFFANNSGNVFQADCNNACAGGGVTTSFSYSISGSNVSITPTSVSSYCGTQAEVPAAFTSSWSVAGNILTLDGQEFEK